ncbi:MAG: hypothetical protein AAF705_01635 [Bacteroidota bacterium]
MLVFIKIILGLIGMLLFYAGIQWMFLPDNMMKRYGISTNNATGRNFVRGDIGGLLIGGATIIFVILYLGVTEWAIPVTVILGAVILGRIVSFFRDGKSVMGIIAVVLELIVIALIIGIEKLS